MTPAVIPDLMTIGHYLFHAIWIPLNPFTGEKKRAFNRCMPERSQQFWQCVRTGTSVEGRAICRLPGAPRTTSFIGCIPRPDIDPRSLLSDPTLVASSPGRSDSINAVVLRIRALTSAARGLEERGRKTSFNPSGVFLLMISPDK